MTVVQHWLCNVIAQCKKLYIMHESFWTMCLKDSSCTMAIRLGPRKWKRMWCNSCTATWPTTAPHTNTLAAHLEQALVYTPHVFTTEWDLLVQLYTTRTQIILLMKCTLILWIHIVSANFKSWLLCRFLFYNHQKWLSFHFGASYT